MTLRETIHTWRLAISESDGRSMRKDGRVYPFFAYESDDEDSDDDFEDDLEDEDFDDDDFEDLDDFDDDDFDDDEDGGYYEEDGTGELFAEDDEDE
ncbi:MAG: hypothetical protein LBG87_07295 [Spirochaetaceae bacterium]|nr:hypothetical protein [Spirochaetaceae bacterium]